MSGGNGIVSEGRVSNLHFIIINERKKHVLGLNKKMTIPLKFTALGRSYFCRRCCCPHTVAGRAGGVSLVGLTTISAAATPRGSRNFLTGQTGSQMSLPPYAAKQYPAGRIICLGHSNCAAFDLDPMHEKGPS